MHDPIVVLRACIAICCIGGVIATLEFVRVLPAFGAAGLYSWRILGPEQFGRMGVARYAGALAGFGTQRVAAMLIAARGVGFVMLPFLLPGSVPFAFVAAMLCLASLLFTWRRFIGDDGSDQMTSILLTSVALAALFDGGPRGFALCLWFLTFQACLSYVAAGVAKALSTEWRDGSAIFKIFNTETYGLRPVAGWLLRFPVLGKVAAWSVIAVECLFPLALVAPEPVTFSIIGLGLLFHVLCAVIMGLNSFLWAFAATYPAILYTRHDVRALLEDLIPGLC